MPKAKQISSWSSHSFEVALPSPAWLMCLIDNCSSWTESLSPTGQDRLGRMNNLNPGMSLTSFCQQINPPHSPSFSMACIKSPHHLTTTPTHRPRNIFLPTTPANHYGKGPPNTHMCLHFYDSLPALRGFAGNSDTRHVHTPWEDTWVFSLSPCQLKVRTGSSISLSI